MPIAFNIVPSVGALPVRFGMHQSEVRRLFGPPDASHPIWDESGTTDNWITSCFNVAYDNEGSVNHIGFRPGGCEVSLDGEPLWSLDDQPDPNPQLLRCEPKPVECVGILIYPALGISTSGYHDGDQAQLALCAFPIGALDIVMDEATPADLSRYKSR